MPISEDLLAENSAQLKRLESVAKARPPNVDLGDGWTGAVALAHLAFWDQRAILLLKRWKERGVVPDNPDDDVLNSALLRMWQTLPLEVAFRLALEAARAVDDAVKSLDERTVLAILERGDDWLLRRGRHRREHLDQIERAVSVP